MIQGRDVVTLDTFSPEEIRFIIARARAMKADGFGMPLQGRALAMVFFNPSLRTRASFAIAFSTLGGTVIDLTAERDIWNLETARGRRDGGTGRGARQGRGAGALGVRRRHRDPIARAPRRLGDGAARPGPRVVPEALERAALQHGERARAPLPGLGRRADARGGVRRAPGPATRAHLGLQPDRAPARRPARRRADGGEAGHAADRLRARRLRTRPRRARRRRAQRARDGRLGAVHRESRARRPRARTRSTPRRGARPTSTAAPTRSGSCAAGTPTGASRPT